MICALRGKNTVVKHYMLRFLFSNIYVSSLQAQMNCSWLMILAQMNIAYLISYMSIAVSIRDLGWAFLVLVFYNIHVRLHSMINNIQFGCISGAVCSCLLPENLQVTTVKQSPEYYECIGISLCSLLKVEIIKFDLTHKLGPKWLKNMGFWPARWSIWPVI